jgi:hypothetical protein
MNATRWTAIIASTLTFVVSGCAGNPAFRSEDAGADPSPPPRTVAVTVKNDNFWDMKVYAVVNSSVPLRLGTVPGMSSAQFIARQSMFPTGVLRLVASQLGGRGTADSGELQVFAGQSVTFSIQPSLATSYAFVR